jgi:hypothetical protein
MVSSSPSVKAGNGSAAASAMLAERQWPVLTVATLRVAMVGSQAEDEANQTLMCRPRGVSLFRWSWIIYVVALWQGQLEQLQRQPSRLQPELCPTLSPAKTPWHKTS